MTDGTCPAPSLVAEAPKLTPLEHLAKLEPLIRIMAAERAPYSLRDDAEQEARIAVWQCAIEHADDARNMAGLLVVVARRAVMGVVTGRPMTGEEGKRGKVRDPLRSRTAELFDPTVDEHPAEAGHADEVDLRVDIRRTLGGLAGWERAYVVGHYMHDRPIAEVAKDLGMSQGGLMNAWSRRLRPMLAGLA